jgi:diadenylate cyclase
VVLDRVIVEIASACRHMSERRHGALIVIERETGLQDYVDTGVELDSRVTSEILQTIFYPNTALHDGAVIVRSDRIVAAACMLPLADTIVSDAHLGTRHRAAVGITEQTDAVSVVVSEETGTMSLARNGRIVRHLDEQALLVLLQHLLQPEPAGSRRLTRLASRAARPKAARTKTT